MNKKLDVGGTLSQIFSTYGAQAGVLLPVAFGLFLFVAVIEGVFNGVLVFGIGLLINIVASTVYQGMVVGLVRDVQDGRRDSSVGELIEATRPVILPLIGAGLLSGIGISIGFLLFVVPGLILLTIWAVIAPVIVVERTGVIEAFGRSRQLVESNGWRVFGVILLVFVIVAAAGFGLALIGIAISDSLVIGILVGLIASTLTEPIAALAASTIYFRLRAFESASPVGPSVSDEPLPGQA